MFFSLLLTVSFSFIFSVIRLDSSPIAIPRSISTSRNRTRSNIRSQASTTGKNIHDLPRSVGSNEASKPYKILSRNGILKINILLYDSKLSSPYLCAFALGHHDSLIGHSVRSILQHPPKIPRLPLISLSIRNSCLRNTCIRT